MKLLLTAILAAGTSFAFDTPQPPKLSDELIAEYANAVFAEQLAEAEAKAAEKRLDALKATKARVLVIQKMQQVCPLTVDQATGKPMCATKDVPK